MDIDLENLLFTEAAPTPKEALKSGIAAIGSKKDKGVVLVSYAKAVKTINTSADFDFDLSNSGGVVGFVKFRPTLPESSDLFQVGASVGVKKYGILAYQAVMYTLRENGGGWLHSDFELTPDSWKVWQKMYQYSNRNGGSLYTAKWLGDWNPGLTSSALDVAIEGEFYTAPAFENAIDEISDKNLTSEKDVTAALKKYAPKCGNLWAYQLNQPMSEMSIMFDKGKELLGLANQNGIDIKQFMQAGINFFEDKIGY